MAYLICRRYLISGRVQGVGYRMFASRSAGTAGVRGWTRNLSDGRVEVCAAGTETQLDDLEGRLRMGPSHAAVRTVQVEDAAMPDVKIEGFHIR